MNESRPRGRRPGRADTRSEILAAALTMFSEVGYEKVSLRAIARTADVDPALVHHYFHSKPELFAEAVLSLPLGDPSVVVSALLAGPHDEIGRRAVENLLDIMEMPDARERFSAMLRAAVSESGAQRPLSELLSKEIYSKVAEGLGHTNAKQRGDLAVSVVLGLVLARDILQLQSIGRMSRAQLVRAIGPSMQFYLADHW
ncbi:MAG: TetR family transcriptional regulator [Actinobacteria bacterium HGW-Actinobacteria-2]|nr:MAG: TetR family transcriptional regulator [Actinobacteria bacterium HGW-Actinobacteria-2]